MTSGFHLELLGDLPTEKSRATNGQEKECFPNSSSWGVTGMATNLKKAKGHSRKRFHTLLSKTSSDYRVEGSWGGVEDNQSLTLSWYGVGTVWISPA